MTHKSYIYSQISKNKEMRIVSKPPPQLLLLLNMGTVAQQ